MRDNVVFEAGLMAGVLGIERVFLATPRDADVHIPSDLRGLTLVEYSTAPDLNVAAAAARIREVVEREGPLTLRRVPS